MGASYPEHKDLAVVTAADWVAVKSSHLGEVNSLQEKAIL